MQTNSNKYTRIQKQTNLYKQTKNKINIYANIHTCKRANKHTYNHTYQQTYNTNKPNPKRACKHAHTHIKNMHTHANIYTYR